MTTRLLLNAAAGAACAMAATAFAQGGDWRYIGSNTLRLENYTIKGDPASGPYPIAGGQYYDEFWIDAFRQLSPYDSMRMQLSGVGNDSVYRSRYKGVVPERINFTRENGDAGLPYRMELGDFFSAYSFRTLQRGLKGAQVELQPPGTLGGARQSLLFTAGTSQLDWRNLGKRVDDVAGASWLLDFSTGTRLAANLVYDHGRADASLGLPERRQTTVTAAAGTGWEALGQRLNLEGEFGKLWGDHHGSLGADGFVVPGSGNDRQGKGVYLQFGGDSADAPLDYLLRYERYDKDYQPAAAVILSDHSGAQAQLGWRFPTGLGLRGRWQHFVDAMQSGNPLRTDVYGVNLAGPLSGGGLAGTLDLFWQDVVRQDKTTDLGSLNFVGNLSSPLPAGWIANLGLYFQRLHDRVPAAPDTHTEQVVLSGTHPIQLGSWLGSITPGVRWRQNVGDAFAGREWAPQIALVMGSGNHNLGANYGAQRITATAAGATSVDVDTLSINYRYNLGQHTFGAEAFAYDRSPAIGQYNRTYRSSVFWIFRFEQPGTMLAAAPSAVPASPLATGASALPALALLLELAPGARIETALARLDQAGIRGGIRSGDLTVFEVRLLRDLSARQRLVLQADGDTIRRSALVVDFSDPHQAAQVARDYEVVRRAMLDRFGSATLNFEEGSILPSFVADLNMNRVVRTMQWTTQSGVLRLGVPRRLDGQARIEIQHAGTMASPRDPVWSIEAVR